MTLAMPDDRDQARIDEEASEWLVLGEDRALSREEQQAFDAWRAADPRHDRTYRALHRTWGDIPNLAGLAELAPPGDAPAPAETAPFARRRIGRISVAAFAAAAAAILAILLVPNLLTAPTERSYATQVAEMGELTLPDGTRVTLGARSDLTVRFSDAERRVVLAGGEAFFDVRHDAARPFVVEAGPSLIRVMGTKFDVTHGAGTVRVSVLEGRVQVSAPATTARAAPAVQLLTAGQRIEIPVVAVASAAAPALPTAVPSPTQAPGAWREGRLVYENARLADLVADVNRYYAPGVTLADRRVGELRVTASFRTSEIPAFMSAVGGVVPVRASEAANGAFRLESAAN